MQNSFGIGYSNTCVYFLFSEVNLKIFEILKHNFKFLPSTDKRGGRKFGLVVQSANGSLITLFEPCQCWLKTYSICRSHQWKQYRLCLIQPSDANPMDLHHLCLSKQAGLVSLLFGPSSGCSATCVSAIQRM